MTEAEEHRERATGYLTRDRLEDAFMALLDLRMSELPNDQERWVLRVAESVLHAYKGDPRIEGHNGHPGHF